MSKNIFLISIILLFSLSGIAQQKKAEKTYKELGYKAAIPLLENQEELSQEDMVKIATGYRLNHDVNNAELWYSQVVKQSSEAIHFLYYAQALHSNEKYELAKEYYTQYQDKMGGNGPDQRGAEFTEAIDRIEAFKHTNVLMKNEKAINTSKLEFSPMFYQDGVVFVSTFDPKERKKKKEVKEENEELDLWINDNFMTLYYAPKEDGELGEPEVFSKNLSTKYHEGPVTFNQSKERIFFSRNQYLKGKKRTDKKGIMKMNIYTATQAGNDWTDIKEMSWNTEEYEEVHPSLTADGQRLYFASNRPGGLGGMDLYYSDFQEGKWGEPVNMGNKINTVGNEIFPFIHQDGTLYFASDGWGGFGGLDIFSTMQKDDLEWVEASNIGTPFNSPKDDFGFIVNITSTEGYLSSARDGGDGKDDIYSFNMKDKNELGKNKIPVTVCVFDKADDKRLQGVEIFIKKQEIGNGQNLEEDYTMRLVETEIDNEYLLKLTKDLDGIEGGDFKKISDGNGEITTQLAPNNSYLFIAKYNGYKIAQYPFLTPALNSSKKANFCIPLKKNYCMVLEGKAINDKYASLIPNAKITLVNLCTGEEQITYTDANGFYSFPCLTCRCDFLINGEKEHFKTAKNEVNTLGDGCENGGVKKANLMFTLGKDAPIVDNANNNFGRNGTTNNGQPYPNRQSPYPNNQPIDLTVGNSIELQNIYYDFDKYYIREGSAEELDWVVRLMKDYPSLVIELSSHTDSRGTSNYNQWLSRKRAKAAVKYIMDRGIQAYRLQAKGAGETLLRNHCDDDEYCTEEEHQYNRRTEIRVLAFDRKDIKVNYINNEPEIIDPAPINRQRE